MKRAEPDSFVSTIFSRLRQELTFVPVLSWAFPTLYLIKSLEACRTVNFILPVAEMRKLTSEKLLT